MRSPGPLLGGLGIKPFEPASPPLLALPHVPHPVAAAAALDRRVKALARMTAQRATAAPASRHYPGRQHSLSPPGPLCRWCVHIGGVDRERRLRCLRQACPPATKSFRRRTRGCFTGPSYRALKSVQAPGDLSRAPAVAVWGHPGSATMLLGCSPGALPVWSPWGPTPMGTTPGPIHTHTRLTPSSPRGQNGPNQGGTPDLRRTWMRVATATSCFVRDSNSRS
jgi:hypothetical protein